MPSFKKRSLSLYLRNGCERQFVLYLYTDSERNQHQMPSRQQRLGLGLVGKAGYDWQIEKIDELKDIFGESQIHENPIRDEKGPRPIDLSSVLNTVEPYQFIVEAAYQADTQTFRNAIGIQVLQDDYGNSVDIGDTRPDIIQVLPSVQAGWISNADLDPDPYLFGVLPDGNLIRLDDNDNRLRLRVIDVKLTSEPGANYFAEVVYYSMTLAGWLLENGFDDQFVVVGTPAIWPGKHDASELAKQVSEWRRRNYIPSETELINALEPDLEIAIFDVFAPRVRSLLTEELPALLSKQWEDLAWHVDYRCKGCEFLSLGKPDQGSELRCYPSAEILSDLSRVYGLSRGGKRQLLSNQVHTIQQLASTNPQSPIFDDHQGLKAKRTTFPYRAESLTLGTTSIIPNSGSDALMPKWPNLRIFIFLDYDLSSAITVTLSIRATWREPLPYGSPYESGTQKWTASNGDDDVFLVDQRTIEREREELLKFLRQLSRILNDVRDQDALDTATGRRDNATSRSNTRNSTYQIYLWDESQKKHLVRLIGRHLPYILQDNSLQELVWLFPPPELLADADEASRKSAITMVKNVVENTVAIDQPHQYDLISLAQHMVPSNLPQPSIHDLYSESFSDLIPMERIHEFWTRKGNWVITQNQILRASRQKVYSLSIVAIWLQRELSSVLSSQTAPQIVPVTRNNQRLPPISKLWLGFTKLNVALDGFETHVTRAMPPHERVSRFRSAHLTRRLEGVERLQAIEQLNRAEGILLADQNTLCVYELHPDSVDVNVQRNTFLYALAPENDYGFFDRSAYRLTEGTSFETGGTVESAQLTSVTVEAIDRSNGLIALRVDNEALIRHWEQQGNFDFSVNVMLDPIHKDFLIEKVEKTLRGIGNPPSASSNQSILRALGLISANPGRGSETPASEILWNAPLLTQQISGLNIVPIRREFEQYLTQQRSFINPSQWIAWENALSRNFTLIWGPPGTGKSRTLRAIVLGKLLAALRSGIPIRVVISANTYTAIDNVLFDLEAELRHLFTPASYALYRIQSPSRDIPPPEWNQLYPSLQNLVLDRRNPSREIRSLLQQLDSPEQLIIVGCTPQQLHNLAIGPGRNAPNRNTVKDWFDLTIIDEASQVDVATGTLILSKRAVNGACVIAGDDKQLPPIHQAEPPEELENIVSSLYNYFRHYHGIVPLSLDINYRSNRTIVEFTKMAGYSRNLESHSPNLKLNFDRPFDLTLPQNWPSNLYWTPDWATLLDPDFPTVSYVYSDVLSSQANDFEADATAALVWHLHNNLRQQLLNERSSTNDFREDHGTLYNNRRFWQHAVGIVTPHRAQRSRVINRLKEIFPNDLGNDIVDAVDTVERYQGQQRDVIIASFGIGDPDLIQAEDEFLYNLNRFNVLVSRARVKIIVLCTESLIKHLSDDIDVLQESRLLKSYTEAFCHSPESLQLGFIKNGQTELRNGIFRKRGFI